MIDKLFGSKTRVKLLHLFMSHPGDSFYVREITRLIDEQINSVRRELSNMLEIGVITSDTAENKLYYQANESYDYYTALRAMFAGEAIVATKDAPAKSTRKDAEAPATPTATAKQRAALDAVPALRLAVFAGSLVGQSAASVDVLLVGNLAAPKVKAAMAKLEKLEGRELRYSVLPYDEFYYRLSVRDKFLSGVLGGAHIVAVDKDAVLKKRESK